jgi:hypothetical protein
MNLILPILLAAAIAPSGTPTQNFRVLSQTYTIDKKYRSMEGPSSVQKITLGDKDTPELLWITGIRTEMVGEDGSTPQLAELMCHVNVDLDPNYHQSLFNLKRSVGSRLMTLSQGMLSAKVPPGYGFPIASNEPLLLFTQVLNLNIDNPKNMKVRHRVTIDYIRDRDAKPAIKPLFNVGASGMVQLENNPIALASSMPSASGGAAAGGAHTGTSCLIGARAPNGFGSSADYVDPQGRKMTGHWIVPPGRQVNHSDVTWFMGLPFDTRMHYAAVHLHPYASELIFRDTTANKVLFRAKATNPMSGVGLARVDRFTSVEGVPLYKSHKYEVVSVYDNPTKENVDSMASIFFGLDDPEFVRPTPAQLAQRSTLLFGNDRFVMRTNSGDVKFIVARDFAVATTMQFARILGNGGLDGARVTAQEKSIDITVPLTKVHELLLPIQLETGIAARTGTLAYCPPVAGDTNLRLRITTVDFAADSRCTTFATIETGIQALIMASTLPDAKILSATSAPNVPAGSH